MYKVVGAEPNPDRLLGEADIYLRNACEIWALCDRGRAMAVPLLPSLLPPAHLHRTEVRETTAAAVTERCWEALSLQGLGHGSFTPSSSTPGTPLSSWKGLASAAALLPDLLQAGILLR